MAETVLQMIISIQPMLCLLQLISLTLTSNTTWNAMQINSPY